MINPSSSIPSERTTVRTAATYPVYDRPFARISWGAVFAGAIIALATQIVLALIGMAIGLATLNPATGASPSGTCSYLARHQQSYFSLYRRLHRRAACRQI
jgi:hypothetical protein